jgi:hypothetical protein
MDDLKCFLPQVSLFFLSNKKRVAKPFYLQAKFACFPGDHALFMQKPVTIFEHIIQHIQQPALEANNNSTLIDNSQQVDNDSCGTSEIVHTPSLMCVD